MSEKRGHLVKMEYDFDTAGVLEVWVPKLNGWYRVTSRDFRSFNGPRRITEPTKVEHGNPWVDLRTYEYHGPVYQWGTNNVVDFSDTGSLVKSKAWEEARKISEDRG